MLIGPTPYSSNYASTKGDDQELQTMGSSPKFAAQEQSPRRRRMEDPYEIYLQVHHYEGPIFGVSGEYGPGGDLACVRYPLNGPMHYIYYNPVNPKP